MVVLAAHIVARDPAILSYILSVPVFMLILFLTRLLAGGLERTGVSTLRPLLLQQLFFLIAFLAVCVVASPRRDAALARKAIMDPPIGPTVNHASRSAPECSCIPSALPVSGRSREAVRVLPEISERTKPSNDQLS